LVCFVDQCQTGTHNCESSRPCIFKQPWSYYCGDCPHSPFVYVNQDSNKCSVGAGIIVVPLLICTLLIISAIIYIRRRNRRLEKDEKTSLLKI